MGRLLLTIGIGLALFGVAIWYFGMPLISDPNKPDAPENTLKAKLGGSLYPEAEMPKLPAVPSRSVDAIIVHGHLSIVEKLDMSPQVEGQILFIGEAVPDGAVAVGGAAAFMAHPFYFAKVDRGGSEAAIFYRQLQESESVRPDQVLAMLDPSRVLNELAGKKAKIIMAQADAQVSLATLNEATSRLLTAQGLLRIKGMAKQEVDATALMEKKYLHETKGKEEGVKLAKIEAEMAEILLRQHIIRNPIRYGNSTVKTIVRRAGATVKQTEPILQLFNVEHLLAEGLLDVQYESRLKRDMPVVVEPAYLDPPLRMLLAHRQEITSVAVSKDETDPLIISASKDKTVCVWSRKQDGPKEVLFHPDAVTVVACPPRACKDNWMLSGCADGSIRVWKLDNLQKPVLVIDEAHTDGITALAFSPDGKWFASGGGDNNICMWNTATGKKTYSFEDEVDPHQGAVTALHFTPQARLVSASRDNSLHVWKLREKGPELEHDSIAGRGGFVSQLGVSEDGRWMLFDQGKSLQMLSVADGRTMSALQKPVGATPFETVAIFSPDSSLILTAGAAEGRLQLWKTPTPGVRGFEVRQMLPAEGSPVTCAVFAPNAGRAGNPEDSFAVSGAKDGSVYIWNIPTPAEVDSQRISNVRLTMIERALDTGVRQMRVGVELRHLSDQQRLIPGLPVTIVIDPRRN